MDLYQPQTGVIRVLEEDMALNPIELKNRIGFVYAENYFNERWTTKQLEKMIAPFIVNGIIKYLNFILKSSIYQSINQ